MALKFVILAACLAAVNAGVVAPVAYSAPITYAAPVAKVAKAVIAEDFDPNPQYSYGYDIHDSVSGDNHNHQETRNGDAVQGSYSLIDADGFHRIVDYTADPIHGFNAVVRREPLGVAKVAAAPVVAKVAYAAPVPKVAYAAPVAKVAYAAPVAKVAYAAPVAKVATYAAPVANVAYAAPIAKVAAPVAYGSQFITHHH